MCVPSGGGGVGELALQAPSQAGGALSQVRVRVRVKFRFRVRDSGSGFGLRLGLGLVFGLGLWQAGAAWRPMLERAS